MPARSSTCRTRTPVERPEGWSGVDRDGNEEALTVPPGDHINPRLSPDGTRIALDTRDDEDDVWVWDLMRETRTRLTFAPERDGFPVWTPDGLRVVFESHRDGGQGNIFAKSADGTGAVERLTESLSPS